MFPLFIVIYYFFWNDADSMHSTKQNYLCLFESRDKAETKQSIICWFYYSYKYLNWNVFKHSREKKNKKINYYLLIM